MRARYSKARGLQSPGFCLLVSLLSGCAVAGHDTRKAPFVFILDGPRLLESRQRLTSGDKSLLPALQKLDRDAKQQLTVGPFSVVNKSQTPPSGDKQDYMSQAPYFWPDPASSSGLPYIRRDGERNPEIRKISDHAEMSRMIDAVQTLSLAYYFTLDERYAARATLLLRTWFAYPRTRMNPNLQFAQGIPGVNTGRGIGIIETQRLVDVIDSVGLLSESGSWTARDQQLLEQWFDQYLKWLMESPNGKDEAAAKNNHGTHYDVQVVTYALFLGKRDLAIKVLNEVPQKRFAVQIESDGSQPLELARTKAWSYSVMNLRGLLTLVHLGKQVGIDLWTDPPRKALEFLEPYARGEKKWPYQQINGFRAEGANFLIRWVNQTPPADPADLENLTGPRLVANPLDSN